jgi:hypothetical protein
VLRHKPSKHEALKSREDLHSRSGKNISSVGSIIREESNFGTSAVRRSGMC